VPSGRIYLDGDVLTAADEGAVQERRKLAFAGSVFVSLVLDGQGQVRGEPQVRLHGLPEEDSSGLSFEERALDAVDEALNRLPAKKRGDDDAVAELVRRSVRGSIRREWGKKAQVSVVLTRI
jgi:ribonuclease J